MTVKYTIDESGLNKQLELLRGYDKIVNKHFLTATQKSLLTIQAAVIDAGVPVGVSGHLRESLGTSVQNKGALNITGRFGTSIKEPYPVVMERGMPPGTFPPPSALMRWVELKIKPESWKVYSVAFNICRAIYHHGIEGRKFFARGWKNAKPKVDQNYRTATDNVVRDLTVKK